MKTADETSITEIASAAMTWQRNTKDLEEAEKELKTAQEGVQKKQKQRDDKAKAVADAAERLRRLAKTL